ncbi:MAG: DNA primase [Bacteroidetes bacterium]|nr:DNA primase [Bacteroidota bacterium]
MINKDTIQNIIETARIEEVVGDYVTLKKRGVNLLGNCPFHNEKTPSFTVSPTKGIFKCFGCGKAGNSVNFLMEHEHLSYPEALRYLAKKYFIDIAEEKETPEQLQMQGEKESLYTVSAYAQKFFSDTLTNTDEGKAIGLSYFKERGFDEKTIEKFQLGYCPEERDGFTKSALSNGHKLEYLVKTGLSISKDNQNYDRFRGRVMFPIHNLSGRVIGFGGRILSSDKTKPKYVNSPESEIYHKSNVLYGIFFAKTAIIAHDNCFLVEGYTDVISMHLSGIENVVASSGTSLTTEQIKLIRRYTPNITILYDGDAAGIKASFRGIDMILEEGMNVKILLFPDGEDPDSYSRKHRPAEVRDFIQNNSSDFISFKTNLLVKETNNDPIKKASLIKEIVETIALIPDAIIRSVYTKECSAIMKLSEQTLINELNKIRNKKATQKSKDIANEQEIPEITEFIDEQQVETDDLKFEQHEKEIIRFMLNYGNSLIDVDAEDEDGERIITKISVAKFIVDDLLKEKELIKIQNPLMQAVFDEYSNQLLNNKIPDLQFFINHSEKLVSQAVIELVSNPYELSENWEKKHRIKVMTEDKEIKKNVFKVIDSYKLKTLDKMIAEIRDKLKVETNEEECVLLQQKHIMFQSIRKKFANKLSRIMTR